MATSTALPSSTECHAPFKRSCVQTANIARPCGLYIDQTADIAYVGELSVAIASNASANGVGPRISLYDTKGNVLARLGNQLEGEAPGQFIAPHGICSDSRGDI